MSAASAKEFGPPCRICNRSGSDLFLTGCGCHLHVVSFSSLSIGESILWGEESSNAMTELGLEFVGIV